MGTQFLGRLHRKKRQYIIIPSILLLVIILAVVIGTVYTRKLTISRMKESLRYQVRNQTTAMKDKIEGKFSLLNGLAVTITEEEIEDFDFMLEEMNTFVKKTEFSEVNFITPNGNAYSNTGEEWSLTDKENFYSCMSGTYEIDRLEEAGRENQFGIFVPVRINQKISGVLLGVYEKERFQRLFKETEAGISDFSCISDSHGTLIASTQAAEMILEEQKSGVIEAGNLFEIFGEAEFTSGSLENIEQKISQEQGGEVSYVSFGERKYGVFEPVGINDWYIVTILREEVIYESSGENMKISGIMLFAVMAVVISIIGYIVVQERRQEALKREEAENMRYILEHDEMTGALTEREFQKRTEKQLQRTKSKEYCLIYLDIFKFKLINEMFGYEKGDELLRVLAKELSKLTAEYNGLCGRISGDKFVLFLPYQKELIETFNTRKEVSPRILPIEIYLHYGVYVIEKTELPVATMIDCAQIAQKSIKGDYDNYIAYYDETLKQQIIREQEIINSMAQALADGEFTIYLQPQYSYRDGSIRGAEALVRWISPTKGIIYPGDFIPIFESNGFIIKLDENVWEQACKLLHTWIVQGKEPMPISINVSRTDLLRGNVAEKLKSLIDKYELTTELLHVEITESAYMDNPQKLIREINRLRDYGFLVEMDDFGSGYSSLNMLKDLPIHVLKTDLKFLEEEGIEERREQILDSVIKMAHQMGLIVVAEGVETKEQAEHLNGLDCEIMQGYYFAKPIPVQDFEELVYGTKSAEKS